MVAAFKVSVERRDAKTAIVVAHISEKPGPVTPALSKAVYFDMMLEGGRWRIDDIRPGTGDRAWSLRNEIVNHKG